MGTKKTSESLFIKAKACHYELLHILEAETERASEELRGISAWIEEIRRAAKRVTGPEDRVRLEDDLHDLSGYETEIKSELRGVGKNLRAVRAERAVLTSLAREQQTFEAAARTSKGTKGNTQPKVASTAHQTIKASIRASPIKFIFRCFECNFIFNPVGHVPSIYCPACTPKRAQRAFSANFRIRRASIDFSISSSWPSQVRGVPYQGGAPGMGKRS